MIPIDIPQLLQVSFINTVSGLAANAFLIILVIVIYRGLKKQIKETGNNIIKNIPQWIKSYNDMMVNDKVVQSARRSMDLIK